MAEFFTTAARPSRRNCLSDTLRTTGRVPIVATTAAVTHAGVDTHLGTQTGLCDEANDQLAADGQALVAEARDKFKCQNPLCPSPSKTYCFNARPLAAGFPQCIKCLRASHIPSLLASINAQETSTVLDDSTTVMCADIGRATSSPFVVNKMAAVSLDGTSYINMKVCSPRHWQVASKISDWKCTTKIRNGCESVVTWPADLKQALTVFMAFLSDVAGSRAEDLVLLFQGGMCYDLPILLHLCNLYHISVRNFSYLDTLPLLFYNSKPQEARKLEDTFPVMFPQHADPQNRDRYSCKNGPYDRCRMTLMCSASLLSSTDQSSAKHLRNIKCTPELLRRFKVLSLSHGMTLDQFKGRFQKETVADVEWSWGCKAPTEE